MIDNDYNKNISTFAFYYLQQRKKKRRQKSTKNEYILYIYQTEDVFFLINIPKPNFHLYQPQHQLNS